MCYVINNIYICILKYICLFCIVLFFNLYKVIVEVIVVWDRVSSLGGQRLFMGIRVLCVGWGSGVGFRFLGLDQQRWGLNRVVCNFRIDCYFSWIISRIRKSFVCVMFYVSFRGVEQGQEVIDVYIIFLEVWFFKSNCE